DRAALALYPPKPGGDDQCLAERVRVPGGSGARLERDLARADPSWIRSLEQRVDADGPGEPVLGAFLRRAGTVSLDVDIHLNLLLCFGRERLRPVHSDRSSDAPADEYAPACDHDMAALIAGRTRVSCRWCPACR